MEKPMLEAVKKKVEKLNHLGVYKGNKYTLEFFRKPTESLNETPKKLDLSAELLGDTYYLIMDQEVFEEGLKDNRAALNELEMMLSFNRGMTGYFFYGLFLLLFLAFLGFGLPINLTGFLLYNFPFWIQVVGLMFSYTLFFAIPIWLLIRFRNDRIRRVSHAKYLLHYLQNKNYKDKLKNYEKTDIGKIPLSKKYMFFLMFPPYHQFKIKVILLYMITLLVFTSALFGDALRKEIPLMDYPVFIRNTIKNDPSTVNIIRSRYEFFEKTDSLTSSLFYRSCDTYYCGRGGFTLLDENLNSVTFDDYLETNEQFASVFTYHDGVAVIRYHKDNVQGTLYKVVSLEEETVLYTFDRDFLNSINDNFHFSKSFYKDGYLFLGGIAGRNYTDFVATLYKLDETGIVDVLYLDKGMRITDLVINDGLLFTVSQARENQADTVFTVLDLEFNIIDEVYYQGFAHATINTIDNNIILRTNERYFYSYHLLDESFQVKKQFKLIRTETNVDYFEDTGILTFGHGTLKTYTEFGSDFETLNQGLDCKTCTNEDYFAEYTFIKTPSQVYAFNSNHTLVFNQLDEVNYTLSRSTASISEVLGYGALFIIPQLGMHILLKKKEALIV